VKKLFPYLDAYLSLPAQERDRFSLSYRFLMDGAPSPALKIAILSGGQRTPLPVTSSGLARPPSLAVLRSDQKAEVSAPAGHKINLSLEIQPNTPPAAEMDAHALALAAEQATAGARKAAGMLGFAAPKLDRVVFKGAAGGQVILASGQSAPLAVVKGDPVFDPARFPTARTVRFARAPNRVLLEKAS
jgi:hypothetical protein